LGGPIFQTYIDPNRLNHNGIFRLHIKKQEILKILYWAND